MQIVNVKQGTQEWLDLRADYFTASEAPAMMSESKYMKRDDLLKQKATGETEEVGDFQKQLFAKGHIAEKLIRPEIEKIIGAELFPATLTDEIEGLKLLASCDGLTMLSDILFEHKLFNKDLFSLVEREGDLPKMYRIQIEQQFILSGAEKCLFVVSDGTLEKFAKMWVFPDLALRKKIINGWKQFQSDLESYSHKAEEVKPAAQAIMELPAINIQIDGQVKSSNLALYEKSAQAFIDAINTDLKTDEDFANAEKTVKFCSEAESKLEMVKGQALEQTADISELFRTINSLKDSMREKRLNLEKSVRTKKGLIRSEIIGEAKAEIQEFIFDLNKKFGIVIIKDDANFEQAIKGKKTIASLRSAANDELARAKIVANEAGEKVEKNLELIRATEKEFLFNDITSIVFKDHDDLKLLIESRINEHKRLEDEKLEAERERFAAEAQAVIDEAAKVSEEQANKNLEKEKAELQELKELAKKPQAKVVILDVIQDEIELSLIYNGIGKITAKKVAKLIIENKIERVAINGV